MSRDDRLLLALLVLDAVVLALLELFFLPLRLDGHLLPEAGDAPLPVTALVALVSTPWLVLTAARLRPKFSVAGAPLLAWLLTLLVFGIGGPGGDVVLLDDWRTLLLLGLGALPGAIALGSIIGKPVS
ncbi:hypothetical protein [Goodfellowiella coeruleoviolacea]|uniref:Uncharacterized protein n=1 Tax=Goodfellowiella coeruleoviolacea TaxID=334858 RepID=A0AAE3GE47_9PSEU|nr:hypothetical protein [Goodfellowiella coeruleoviolacea]MCP2165627.1 hypothetical protein [Goodfellowiella coeruleoviolacea]